MNSHIYSEPITTRNNSPRWRYVIDTTAMTWTAQRQGGPLGWTDARDIPGAPRKRNLGIPIAVCKAASAHLDRIRQPL